MDPGKSTIGAMIFPNSDPNVAPSEPRLTKRFEMLDGYGNPAQTAGALRTHNFENWEYLRHSHLDPPSKYEEIGVRGMNTTKFHRGFQRRRECDIPKDTARKKETEAKAARAVLANTARKEQLAKIANSQGYNILTGVDLNGEKSLTSSPRSGGAIVSGAKDTESKGPRETQMDIVGRLILRDSHYRFFAPQTTGNNLINRRMFSDYNEGTRKPHMSSIIGVGRDDLPSNGIADQFQYADYGEPQYRASVGTSALMKRRVEAQHREIQCVRDLQ